MATFTVSTDTNYSSLSGIANNDSITINSGAILTVDTSTIDIDQVQCISFGTMQINNTSTTTPIVVNVGASGSNRRLRFEAGGKLIARGDRIQIGTGDGTANQVISLPTSDTGANLPNLGGLWSEQGDTLRDSTSIPRLHLQVADASNACTLEEVREIFTQDTTANTVTMVYPVPVGDPIYMSNIIIAKGATASGTPFFDTANSGTIDLQYIHIGDGWDVNLASASSSIFDYVAIADTTADFGLNNQINAPVITNTIFVGPTSNPTVNLSASANAGTFKNVWADSGLMNNNGFNISNTANGYFEKVRNTCYRATSNSTTNARGAFYVTGPNHTFYDCTTATGSQIIYATAGSSNIKADNLRVMHGCRSTHAETAQVSLLRLQNTANNVITRLHHQDPEVFGGFNSMSDALDIDAGTVDCIIDDVVIYAGSVASTNSVINEAGANNRYNNITVNGLIRNKCVDFQTSSLGAEISNLVFTQTQTATTNCELGARARLDQIGTGRTNNTIASNAVGTGVDCISALFYDFNDDGANATGRWHTRMSPTVEETDYYTEITKTGAIVFNNNNQLYMTQAGDQIELQSRVHYNITGSDGGYGIIGNSASNFTIEFALRRPNGAYTTYQTPDATNFNSALASLDADSQNALQIKWRITRDVSNASDNLQALYFNVTLSGDSHPFSIGVANLTITGLQPNSEVRVYDGVDEIMGEENTGTTFTGEYTVPYSNGAFQDRTVTIAVHSVGYVTERFENVTLTSAGFSLPVSQRFDRNYANP